mgnify:CR=1 FL=1
MLEELQKIRTAAQLLSVREPALAEPLLGACATIWKQIYELTAWRADLEARARRVAERVSTADGNVEDAVTAMDSTQAQAVAREIMDFASEFEAKNGALV